MAIKGTAIIQLTDVATGQTHEIIHDNMVTNAVSDMCNTAGFFRAPITCSALNTAGSIAENMFGGLMLWSKPLDVSSADDYYLPADNDCVGYGCHLANSSINNMMGSLNEAESGKIDKGYRFVWDFATNQANGQISAVSLVPRVAGQLGIGLAPDDIAPVLDMAVTNFNTSVLDAGSYQLCRPYLYAADNVLYGVSPYNLGYNSSYANSHISRNGKKLVLKRYRFPTTKIHLSDQANAFNIADSDIEIQLPDSFQISETAKDYYGFCNYDAGFIYLCIGTHASGAAINTQVCKISTDDWSCSVIDVRVTLETSITWCTQFLSDLGFANAHEIMRRAQVRNNKILIAASPAYCIDLSAPVVATTLTYRDATNANISDLYASAGKFVYCMNKDRRACMINTESGAVSVLNAIADNLHGIMMSGSSYSARSISHIPCVDKRLTIALFTISAFDKENITCAALPHVLTTKNNLETPVTKTADKTMKITYILREE